MKPLFAGGCFALGAVLTFVVMRWDRWRSCDQAEVLFLDREAAIARGVYRFHTGYEQVTSSNLGEVLKYCYCDLKKSESGDWEVFRVFKATSGGRYLLFFNQLRDSQGNDVVDRVMVYICDENGEMPSAKFFSHI